MLPQKYRKLILSLLAVLSLVLARETGLDAGLIDAVMDGISEAVVEPEPDMPLEAE